MIIGDRPRFPSPSGAPPAQAIPAANSKVSLVAALIVGPYKVGAGGTVESSGG
jgi:hypothetical protein